MAKAVLISIRPKWCEKIANGEKTVDVRKTKPYLETPFKCYIYCTNTRPFLVWVMFSGAIGLRSLPIFRGMAEQKQIKSGTFSTGMLLGSLCVTPMSQIRRSDMTHFLMLRPA